MHTNEQSKLVFSYNNLEKNFRLLYHSLAMKQITFMAQRIDSTCIDLIYM